MYKADFYKTGYNYLINACVCIWEYNIVLKYARHAYMFQSEASLIIFTHWQYQIIFAAPKILITNYN